MDLFFMQLTGTLNGFNADFQSGIGSVWYSHSGLKFSNGVFAETKNMKGWIFGSPHQKA